MQRGLGVVSGMVLAVACCLGASSPAHAAKKPLTPEQIQGIVSQVEADIQELISGVQADAAELLFELQEVALELVQNPGEVDPAQIQRFASQVQKSVLKNEVKLSKRIEKVAVKAAKKLGAGGAEQEILDQLQAARANAIGELSTISEQIQSALGPLLGGGLPSF